MPKLDKAARRDAKRDKKLYGMRVSGASVRLLNRLGLSGDDVPKKDRKDV